MPTKCSRKRAVSAASLCARLLSVMSAAMAMVPGRAPRPVRSGATEMERSTRVPSLRAPCTSTPLATWPPFPPRSCASTCAFAGLHVLAQRLRMLRLQPMRDDRVREQEPDDLFAFPAEGPFRGCVPLQDPALRVHCHEGVERRGEDGRLERFALPHFLLRAAA